MSIEVELRSANGPRVLVSGEYDEEEIEAALPPGWTVGENWTNGVRTTSGAWSYPLVKAKRTVVLDSKRFEDHDDCLAAAVGFVAAAEGLEAWQCDAAWDDDVEREKIVVTIRSEE